MYRRHVFVFLTALVVLFAAGVAHVSTAAAVMFAPCSPFTVGSTPCFIAIGDVNGDGRQDVVAANTGGTTLTVLVNDGAGGFAPGVSVAAGTLAYSHPYGVAAGDVNGDGRADLVASTPDTNTVSVILADERGGFGAPVAYATGDSPYGVTVGDVDGDGDRDLVVTQSMASTVGVLLNDGSGGFGSRTDYATGAGPYAVVVRDFNGDRDMDLATCDLYEGTVSVLLNDGSGGFLPRTPYAAGDGCRALVSADFNGDGRPDLASVGGSGDAGAVSVLLNTGGGAFGAKTDYLTGPWPQSLAVGDLNGDRKTDLVCVLEDADTASVLLGNGAGAFGAWAGYTTGDRPYAVGVADFDRDGRHDVATADSMANAVGLLRNTTLQRIYSLSPTRGKVGATVTITGWGFGRTRGTSKVYFGTKAATSYVYWSAGKIKVKVPSVTKGKKAVRVQTSFGKSGAKYFTVI